MTERQFVRYLLKAPLHPKAENNFGLHPGRYALSILPDLGALGSFQARLISSIAMIATPRFDFGLIVLKLLPNNWAFCVSVCLHFMRL